MHEWRRWSGNHASMPVRRLQHKNTTRTAFTLDNFFTDSTVLDKMTSPEECLSTQALNEHRVTLPEPPYIPSCPLPSSPQPYKTLMNPSNSRSSQAATNQSASPPCRSPIIRYYSSPAPRWQYPPSTRAPSQPPTSMFVPRRRGLGVARTSSSRLGSAWIWRRGLTRTCRVLDRTMGRFALCIRKLSGVTREWCIRLMSGREKGCEGKAIPFTNPGIANFDKYKFENELSSVRCDFIWGWPKKSA